MTAARESALEPLAATFLRVTYLLDASAEAQWQRGHTPRALNEGVRGKNTVSDPTGSTVIDDRRLALRAAVVEAERAQAAAMRTLRVAEAKLTRALQDATTP